MVVSRSKFTSSKTTSNNSSPSASMPSNLRSSKRVRTPFGLEGSCHLAMILLGLSTVKVGGARPVGASGSVWLMAAVLLAHPALVHASRTRVYSEKGRSPVTTVVLPVPEKTTPIPDM